MKDDVISRQDAIDTVKWGITYAKAINKSTGEVKELFKEGNKVLNEAAERLKELPSAQLTQEEFENELHDMFGHIWDCEIDHPIFQDTVGDIMEAVILLVYNNYTGKKGEQKWKG